MDAKPEPLTASRRRSVRVQQTNATTNASDVQNTRPALHKRTSLRLRPPAAKLLKNAEPPSSLDDFSQSERLFKMPFFSFFKNPKMDRQEAPVEARLHAGLLKEMNGPMSPASVPIDSVDAPSRPASVASAKAASVRSEYRSSPAAHPPLPPLPAGGKLRKASPFEHPPLFQAYSQATKQGILTVSSTPNEALNNVGHQGRGADISNAARISVDARRTSHSLTSPNNASIAGPGLTNKIFVLSTSGLLLQYAETGSSDRLPEKVLCLGKASAAFACDAIPGKHYVIQVSQTVDGEGNITNSSKPFFSRFGVRNTAAKRMTSTFLLVLPNASEMESWLAALREEIEVANGYQRRAGSARDAIPSAGQSTSALERAPSHTYQVKRDPNKTSPVSSPRNQSTSSHSTNDADHRSEPLTIGNNDRATGSLDTEPIYMTDETLSADQYSGRSLTVHVDDSTSMRSEISKESNILLAATLTGALPLRQSQSITTSSSADSHYPNYRKMLSEEKATDRESQCIAENGMSAESANLKAPTAPVALSSRDTWYFIPRSPSSFTVMNQPPIPERAVPSRPVAHATSESETERDRKDENKHDSKIEESSVVTEREDTHVQLEDTDELGMLPNASEMPQRSISSAFVTASTFTSTVHSTGARRIASFSMPLKVNPAGTSTLQPSGNPRPPSNSGEAEVLDDSPVGLAIAPPAALAEPAPVSCLDTITLPRPASSGYDRSPPGRLSPFLGSPCAANALNPMDATPKLPISVAMRKTHSQPAYSGVLKRPSSTPIRSDPAPFLPSVRPSTGNTDLSNATAAVPQKPYRPSTRPGILPSRQASIEALKAFQFNTPVTSADDAFLATPLRSSPPSTQLPSAPATTTNRFMTTPPASSPPSTELPPVPPSSRAGSRCSARRNRPKSPLPYLDFGIPIVGLGPPAPPPQMPLPAPPPGSRPISPMSPYIKHPSIEHVAGLGISVI